MIRNTLSIGILFVGLASLLAGEAQLAERTHNPDDHIVVCIDNVDGKIVWKVFDAGLTSVNNADKFIELFSGRINEPLELKGTATLSPAEWISVMETLKMAHVEKVYLGSDSLPAKPPF